MRVLAIVAVLLVAGCARVSDADRCSSYGFSPGTDGFAGCVQRERLARSQSIDAIISGHVAAQGARDAAAYNGLYGR